MVTVLKKAVDIFFQEAVDFVKKMEEEGFNIMLVKLIAQSTERNLISPSLKNVR